MPSTASQSTLLQVEQSIVSLLKGNVTGWQVLPFPDDPEEIGKPTTNKQIFVGWRRETLTEPPLLSPVGNVAQQRSIEYEILLKSKDLRTHQGTYPVVDELRDLLTGYQPIEHCRGMYQISAQFVDARNGLWLFGMTFALKLAYEKRRRF